MKGRDSGRGLSREQKASCLRINFPDGGGSSFCGRRDLQSSIARECHNCIRGN